MRFLADQDVYGVTVDFLIALGHDVVTAAQLGLSRDADIALLAAAQADQRILVTRDRDYGAIRLRPTRWQWRNLLADFAIDDRRCAYGAGASSVALY